MAGPWWHYADAGTPTMGAIGPSLGQTARVSAVEPRIMKKKAKVIIDWLVVAEMGFGELMSCTPLWGGGGEEPGKKREWKSIVEKIIERKRLTWAKSGCIWEEERGGDIMNIDVAGENIHCHFRWWLGKGWGKRITRSARQICISILLQRPQTSLH
jgi:hypothetical protein